MSGLVLAVGALMGIAGIAEMYVGSGDILSERGWSAFIAGAVLLAGGVVTMGVGIVVRVLEQVRRAIPQGFALPAAGATPQRIEPASVEPFAEASNATPAISTPVAIGTGATAPLAFATEAEHVDDAEHGTTLADLPRPPLDEPGQDLSSDESAAADWFRHDADGAAREPARRHPLRPAYDPGEAPAPQREPVEREMDLVHDGHAASTIEGDGGEPAIAAPVAYTAEPLQHEPTVAEPAREATVSAREQPAGDESAVIGRYESEGTSYVMYADGSIDAQSEAGVYRFASMAELKAFIES